MKDGERFVLVIRALRDPDGVPVATRVRSWIKSGLRRHYLRVEKIDGPPPLALQRSRLTLGATCTGRFTPAPEATP